VRLVLKLESRLSQYDTIVGDDASARLIAMFFRDLIKKKREEAGLEPPQTFFVAGGRGDHSIRESKIKDFFESKKDTIGKVLLVTEYMSSGKGMNWLVEVIANIGIDFDLATLSVEKNPEFYDIYPEMAKRLNYGSIGTEGQFFYNKSSLTGVDKHGYDELNDNVTAHGYRNRNAWTSHEMKPARQSLYALADEVNEKLLK